ncbi:MAG: choice-of-anchor D domain-containing protein, partial [Acidobacteriales bacterium]|nr:choice-of-anchor D domain-containing protein [Terriglobales bacterium]
MQRLSSRSAASVCLFLFAVGSAAMAFTGSVTVTPTRANLGQEAVGLKTRPVVIQVTNGTNKGVSVTSISLTGSQFQLTQGIAPIVVGRGTSTTYTILFAPTVTGRATGTFTITLSNQTQPLTVSLMGTGVVSTAVASPSATSLTFGPIEQGLVTSQLFTLTNTGAQSFGLRQVITDPPFSNDPVSITTVAAGASVSFNVYFSPTTVGSFTDNMILDFDTVPQQAIALSGSSTTPSTLAVTTSNLLPAATQNAAYLAPLAATLGTPPYTWAVQSGSTLPSGLTLSTDGIVSGTVASTVVPGSYKATVQVTDSSVPPLVTPKLMTIPVGAPTGAACNNIVTNSTEGTGPLVPIDVLGTGTYFGSMGGLYDLGS